MKSKLETEYEPLYTAWKAGPSKETTGALLRSVEPVISNAIRSYASGTGSPTLRSRARQLATQSFKSYDPARGTLRSHLLSRLQRLRRLAAQEQQIIRVPEQVSLDQIRTAQIETDLQEKLGRPPSDQEIADKTGLSLRRLAHIRQGRRPIAEGRLQQVTPEDAGGYAPAVQPVEQNYDVGLEFVYDDQDPQNQFIMERAFGLHGHPQTSATDIARAMKLTPGAVSHRMQQIQGQIDELESLGGI